MKLRLSLLLLLTLIRCQETHNENSNKREFHDLMKPRRLYASKNNEIFTRNSISRGKKRLISGQYYKDEDTGLQTIEMERKKAAFLERRFQNNPLIRDYHDVIRTKKEPYLFVTDELGRKFPLLEKQQFINMERRKAHTNFTRANISPIYGQQETAESFYDIYQKKFPEDYAEGNSPTSVKIRDR